MTRRPPPGDGSPPAAAAHALRPDRTIPLAPAVGSAIQTLLADDPQHRRALLFAIPRPGPRDPSPPTPSPSRVMHCAAPSRARRAGSTAATHRDEPTAHRRLAAAAQPPAAGAAE